MFYSTTVLLAATALSGLVSAQNYSTSGNISVVPSSVDYATRQAWCRAQTNTCPLICGVTSANTCDPGALTYVCTCQSGSTPNISDYTQTLPFYVCEQWRTDCTADHPNDLDGQTACQSLVCGSKNASESSTSSSSSSAAASTTSSAASSSATGGSPSTTSAASATSATAAATSKSAAMAMNLAQSYGTGVLGAGLLALFGLVL
ncbi:hypothetical protein MBLNU459_g0251t2 [Dothideomycetes sp. NU459]